MAVIVKAFSLTHIMDKLGGTPTEKDEAQERYNQGYYLGAGLKTCSILRPDGSQAAEIIVNPSVLTDLTDPETSVGNGIKKIIRGRLFEKMIILKTLPHYHNVNPKIGQPEEANQKFEIPAPLTDITKGMTEVAEKVDLREATQLLQPVRGTDSSSTYFVVALSEAIKAAVRIKNNRVSFRIDGDFTQEIIDSMVVAGFTPSNKGHYSMHLDCVDAEMARKTVGSLLFSSGIPFDQATTNTEGMIG